MFVPQGKKVLRKGLENDIGRLNFEYFPNRVPSCLEFGVHVPV